MKCIKTSGVDGILAEVYTHVGATLVFLKIGTVREYCKY